MLQQLARFELHQFLRFGRLEVQREELVDAERQALLGEQVKAEDRFQAQEELRSPTAGSAARAGPSQARTASPAPPAGSTAGAGPSQARTASQSPTEELHALLKRRIPTSRAEEEELAEVLRILASPQQQARLAIEEFHRNLLRRFGGARQDIAEPSVASSRPPQSDNPPTS
jgi:hypothetical protein